MSQKIEKPMIVVPGPLQGESETAVEADRRSSSRYPFTAAADVMELPSLARITGRSSDLGLSGCYIDVLSPFGIGSIVRVRLEREQKVFEAVATVIYTQVSIGMGLSFTQIELEYQSILQSWVAELSGEQLPKGDVAPAGIEQDLLANIINVRQVLSEMIKLMIRRRIIGENEGAVLLRQMYR